jgi:hypothetical protein
MEEFVSGRLNRYSFTGVTYRSIASNAGDPHESFSGSIAMGSRREFHAGLVINYPLAKLTR